MGVIYNSIFPGVSNGLVLNLDAGIQRSYSGSGTVWNNLVGTDNVSLTNGIGFERNNQDCRGGTLIFDGVDDYVDFIAPNLGGTATVEMWAKVSSFGGMMMGWGSYDVYTPSGMLGYNTANSDVYGISSATVTSLNLLNNWIHYVFEMRTDVSYTNNKIYINGVSQTLSQQLSTESGRSFNSGNGRISGWRIDNGYRLPMRCALFRVYNRSLTQNEVTTNYNAIKGKSFGSYSNPFTSPVDAQTRGYPAGTYYFKSGAMSSPLLLEYEPNYYEGRPFCCVFRSPYRSTATTNRIDLNIPMGGLLVQRDTLDLRAAVYWSTPITYNTVGGAGNNTADSGYSPRRVILGGAGGHGIFATNQTQCNWGSATGAIGAGWDGTTCGSFPNDLVWGTGRSDTATYENRSGTWSHWITWS